MELKQLKYFIAIAEELHFQRASRRVHITQPALSHQIKVLEGELEASLVDRSRSHVKLTPAGEVLLEHARRILSMVDEATNDVKQAAGIEPQELRIATIDYLNLDSVTKSIMAMRVKHGMDSIQQIEMPTHEVFNAVKEGMVDIGIGPLPVTHPALVVKTLIKGHWSVVLPCSHPLNDLEEIPLSKLQSEPLILFDKALNPKLYSWWMEQFKQAGFAPKIVLETKQVSTALRMVQDGSALYLVASYIVPEIPDNCVIKALSGFETEIKAGAAWREDNNNTLLKQYLNELRTLID